MTDLQTVLAHNPDCPVRQIGDGLVIMAPEGETTHSLEDIGAFIWSQIDGSQTLEGILEAIVSNYEVEKETAQADLLAFVQQMIDAKLLLPA